MPSWRLECLGYPTLFDPSGEVVRLGTRKHLALLAYLAVESRSHHRRDRLANLLWPRATQAESRHSLATALSSIRRSLGSAAIGYSIDTVTLEPEQVVTDAAELLNSDPLLDPERLGIFLDEFEIRDSNDYAAWVDAERARLLVPTRRLLARLIDEAGVNGDSDRMRRLARRLTAIDPLSEDSIKANMEIHAMAGDWIGAIQVYRTWCVRLEKELGAEPSQEVIRLAHRLRRRGGRPERRMVMSSMVREGPGQESIIGRDAEHQTCHEAWEEVSTGRSRVLILTGGYGLGKTTLLDQLTTTAAVQGAAVAVVTCHEPERDVPLGIIGALVRQLISLPGSGASSPRHLAELNLLVSEIGAIWPAVTELRVEPGSLDLLRLSDALHGLIESITVDQPLVIGVDDLHLADNDSLTVMHLLARRLGEIPALLVLAGETDSSAMREPGRDVTTSIIRLGASKLELLPLDLAASRLLLGNQLGSADPGPIARDAILAASGGIPLLIKTLAEDWIRHGDESIAMAIDAMTPRARVDIPEAIAAHVAERLALLDNESRAVLDLASLLGDRLNDLGMYTMLDLSVGRVATAVRSLTASRLLKGRGERLGFDSGTTRSYCYADMPQPVREVLHSRIADRLLPDEEQEEAELSPGFEVAWHLIRSDRVDEAVPHLLRGGRDALHDGDLLKAGHALTSSLPVLSGAPLREAQFLLAETRMELGLWGNSLEQLAELELEGHHPWLCQRDLLVNLNRRWGGEIGPREVSGELERLFAIVESEGVDSEFRAKALSGAVAMLSGSWEREETVRLGELADRALASATNPYERMHVLFAKAWADACLESPRAAIATLNDGIKIADALGAKTSVAMRLYLAAGVTRCKSGDYEDAVSFIQRACEIAEHTGNPALNAYATQALALVCGRLGNREEQISWATKSLASTTSRHWDKCTLAAAHELSMGLSLRAREKEAEAAMVNLESRFGCDSSPWAIQVWLLMKADIFQLQGRKKRALSVARKATNGKFDTLLESCAAGPFARWQAVTSRAHTKASSTSVEVLDGMFENRVRFDAKDRVEVMLAYFMIHRDEQGKICPHFEEARCLYSALPAAVRRDISRLGFMVTIKSTLGKDCAVTF